MPIPSREKNEDKDLFVQRCISSIIDEYGQEQAAAICYKAVDEKMSKMEDKEVFVLSPRKSENRGKYLQRCAAHPKMKEQYGDKKERAIFCLTSFNEYYKWWVKMEEFGEEDTKGTALGACITKKKAQGIDYKQAYRECASKVVAPSGPIVLSEDEDNLIIEPVMFQDCPPATLDIPLNIANRQKCIDQAHYGPLDPNLPNEDYWKKKADMFNTTPSEAKKALCGNCSFFVQTSEILDCIAEGLGDVGVDPYDSIKAGNLGYCEAYDFKCAASRTCDAWVVGGPVVDDFAEGKGLEDACWEGYEAIGLKDDGTPNCVPVKMTENDFADTYNDYPESVKNAAKRAVDYAEKNGWGSCGTGVGKQRASQLAKGENISVDTIKRMYSYLSRHKTDLTSSKSFEDGCGYLMYMAWGGESALGWAERKLKQLEKK